MADFGYLMESDEETLRLEVKTRPEDIRRQAEWSGIKPGLTVLDVGCGPGKTTAILHELIQPGGFILGIDQSSERIRHARENYGGRRGIDFQVCNFLGDLTHIGRFDLIWVRFVLEYYRAEGPAMVGNLKKILKPGGQLCLIDLDHNCLNHYELPPLLGDLLFKIMDKLQRDYNFDPYAGRKLYSYLFDQGFSDIKVHLMAHHLFYGEMEGNDLFNWMKKLEVVLQKYPDLLADYSGGYEGIINDFRSFFLHPRRFTYTPLIMCKGTLT